MTREVTTSKSELEQRLSENAWREFCEGWEDDFCPRIKRKPSVWATETRIIAAGTSPMSNGVDMRYDHAVMPHCVEPMDAADDPAIRKIVLWFAIREGKTNSVCANILGRTVTDSPANVYSVHPTDDNAAAFSNGDVEPMIQACLEGYFVEKKSRDTGRTIEFKKFKGGWIRIVTANALDKFRGTSVGVLFLHELDALNPEAIFKAIGRTTGFANAIIVMESSGTLAAEYTPEGKKVYRSNIEEAYDQGDQRKWFCPCRKCGFLQTTKYEQIKYPPGKPEKAVYICEACDKDHNPREWRRMAGAGVWFPTAGLVSSQLADIESNHRHSRALDPSVRSYWRNGFASLLPHSAAFKSKLHQFAVEGESAQRTAVAKMIWMQEVKAELWSPESEGEAPPAWKPIYERRESYDVVIPHGGLFLTCFVDVQKYRLEIGWRAFGRNEENWGMDHHVIEGYVGDTSTWRELRFYLATKWKHASGATMALGMGFVDGGKWPDQVYKFFQELARDPMPGVTGHLRASKGFGMHGHPIVTRKMMTVGKTLKGHHIGTWEAKDRIYERLRMQTPALVAPRITTLELETKNPTDDSPDAREGIMHFNERYSEEYFQQLTVEKVTVVIEKGQEVRKYENKGGARNEALDIEVGCLAAYRLYPRNLEQLEAELLSQVEKPEEEQQMPVAAPMARRSPFGKGWSI